MGDNTLMVGEECEIVFAVQPEHQDQVGDRCVIDGSPELINTVTHGVVRAYPIRINGQRWHALPEQLKAVLP